MITNYETCKNITKESYEATAKAFADKVAELAPLNSIERFAKLLPPKAKILDIGCGSGRDAKYFCDLGFDVLGIDFCSNLLKIAKAHAPLAHFQQMDMERLDFRPLEFDGVWSACSLGHLSKEFFPTVLNQIYSLLKENGAFYLTLKKGSGEGLEIDTRYPGEHRKYWSYYNDDELKKFIERAGFKIIDFAVVEKNHAYQTHPAFRIFCQKKLQ